MQVIGEQALVDILDLSEVAWTCWGVSTPRSGLGLRMVKELDLQLALGMNERRKTGSLPVHDMHRWGVGGSNLGQTQSWTCLFNFVRSFPLHVEHLMEGFISLSVLRGRAAKAVKGPKGVGKSGA